MDRSTQLDNFCRRVTGDTWQYLKDSNLDCDANQRNAVANWKPGRTFAKIVNGSSTRYFVRMSDGMIFASATWKKYNPNRSFGTLDTIDDFFWGNYEGFAKANTPWTMTPTRGGYFTATPKT